VTIHLDDAVGGALERAVIRHHRKRLTRLGHDDALTPAPSSATARSDGNLWVSGTRQPRTGNSVDVLIDGDQAFAAMADELARATSHIHIAGWHLTPELRLRRDEGFPSLRDLLAELAQRVEVRVLLWAGPPVPAFSPTRASVKEIRAQLTNGTAVQCVLDARERTLHCHHEKIIVIDDEVAFVGGIDLSTLSGDRWDSSDHPPRGDTGWHDVATRLRGPVVADVAQHFRDRWQEVAKSPLPAPAPQPPAGNVTVQLLRTVPEATYDFAPQGEFSILEAYLRALSSAERFIYLENQFLWSAEVVETLAEKLRTPPTPDFRLVLLLPARPSNGKDTTRGQLGRLLDADDGRGMLLPTTIRALRSERKNPLYVHAKVGIIDDRWLTIGSANLNEHSLFNDTEVNILTMDTALARSTRLSLWSEHLEQPVTDIDGDPVEVIDRQWKPLADEQLARDLAGQTATHRLIRLAAVSRRTERLLGPARGLLVDG
jgi:phosphatidylserine/phosphatidylglycerophosphate/cardiolipin synthase-like enzyme